MNQYAPIFLRQSSYLEALNAVPWLLGGGLFLGVFYNLSLWYKLTDKTLYGAYISLLGAFVTLILNWALIPLYGFMGSAYATFISYLIMVIISYLWGRRHYAVPYEISKIIFYIALAGSGIVLNEYLGGTLTVSLLIAALFLTLSFLFEKKNFSSTKS